MKYKLVPLIAAVTITAAALAACGGSGGSGNSKATAPPTSADHSPVTITKWEPQERTY